MSNALTMRRTIFDEEHELFRDQFRCFAAREVEPKIPQWNETGFCDRQTWRRMGEEGYLGANPPAEYRDTAASA